MDIKDKEQYLQVFDRDKRKEAHQCALDIRKFEIDLYWKRATYFWTFIAATLTGYFAVNSITNTPRDLLVLLNCLGLIFSVSWYMVNRGSKFWQENWEIHVDLLEDNYTGPLYKTTLDTERYSWKNLNKAFGYSVSKINQLLSLFIIFLWIALYIHTFSFFKNFSEAKKFVINWVLIIGTVVFLFMLHFWCQNSSNKDKKFPKLIVREYKKNS